MTACYLCGQPLKLYFIKAGYEIWKCPSCGLSQTEFRQKYAEFVTEFYNEGYFTGDVSRSAYTEYFADKPFIFKNLTKHINQIRKIKPRGKLLDVGCAMGFMMELANLSGYNAFGFDPSAYAISQADKIIKKQIKLSTIDTVIYPKADFDIITMFDVLEHLSDPVSNLKKLVTFLKKDGIISIATGDTDSFMAKVLGKRWTFYIPPQHLFFFNRKNLVTLLNQAGLEPICWFRVDKWLSLKYVLHLAHSDSRFPFADSLGKLVKQVGWGNLPVFLPIRDNINVIARKRL
jgi:2-polyprenyl-3-methyl-5-hydroxy-6-metoxy-1,4-benzoquinol methylase